MPFSYKRHEVNAYLLGGRRGCDRIVVGFITTYASNAYHHYRWEFESRSSEVFNATICNKVVSDSWQVCGFLRVLRFPPTTKLTSNI
jgi:hypothetical protein